VQGDTRTAVSISEELIFIPYWTLSKDSDTTSYDTLVYFGIAANENGIVSDAGSENVEKFNTKATNAQKKLLTLRMVDHDTNTKILDDKNVQKKIIQQTISFAKENNFDGIVIDFESKSLGFEEVTDSTTDFITQSVEGIKKSGLEAHTLLFGDNYYRARAFDVERIAKVSDSIMIMSYDFHKSGGSPGPTFPTSGKEVYGYDFPTMLEDFASDAQRDKTVVIIGMFGYDWKVDKDGNSIVPATPLTFGEADLIFLNSCNKKNCKVEIDKNTYEAKITYTEDGNRREAWVETRDSKDKKVKILEKYGISKVGYWAYSFF